MPQPPGRSSSPACVLRSGAAVGSNSGPRSQLDHEGVAGALDGHLEFLPRVAFQGVIDNVTAAFFERKCQAVNHRFRNTRSAGKFLQRLHRAHDFLRRGLEIKDPARFAVSRGRRRLAGETQRQDRDVVGLGGPACERADFSENFRGDLRCRLPAQRAGIRQQPLVAVTFLLRIERLSDPVGIKDEHVILAQRQFRTLELQARLESEGGAEVLYGPARRRAGGQQHGPAMAGIGQDEPVRSWLEHGTQERDEHSVGIVRGELVVQPRENALRLGDFPRQQPRQADRPDHEHRSGNSFARDVTDENHQPVRCGRANAVKVAAYFARRFEHSAETDAVGLLQGGEIVRQHAHLDFAGDAQFAGDLFLHRVAVGLRFEQRPHARLDLQHLERLGQIIVGARLEAARLVLHFFKRREKHDGHLGCLRHLAQPSAHLVAVQARHHDVEQHQVGGRARGGLQCHLAIQGQAEFVIALETFHEDVEIGLGVVHQQHAAIGKRFHAGEALLCACSINACASAKE